MKINWLRSRPLREHGKQTRKTLNQSLLSSIDYFGGRLFFSFLQSRFNQYLSGIYMDLSARVGIVPIVPIVSFQGHLGGGISAMWVVVYHLCTSFVGRICIWRVIGYGWCDMVLYSRNSSAWTGGHLEGCWSFCPLVLKGAWGRLFACSAAEVMLINVNHCWTAKVLGGVGWCSCCRSWRVLQALFWSERFALDRSALHGEHVVVWPSLVLQSYSLSVR